MPGVGACTGALSQAEEQAVRKQGFPASYTLPPAPTKAKKWHSMAWRRGRPAAPGAPQESLTWLLLGAPWQLSRGVKVAAGRLCSPSPPRPEPASRCALPRTSSPALLHQPPSSTPLPGPRACGPGSGPAAHPHAKQPTLLEHTETGSSTTQNSGLHRLLFPLLLLALKEGPAVIRARK